MKIGPNQPCPCHSGRKYKRCCRYALEGHPVDTPEALMRSRYAGYATGNAAHILRTTHPEGPHWRRDAESWAAEVREFCANTQFLALEVLDHRVDGDRGMVDFKAHVRVGETDTDLSERSLFLRHEGRWLYHSGATR